MKYYLISIAALLAIAFSSCKEKDKPTLIVQRGANGMIKTTDGNLAVFGFNSSDRGNYNAYLAKLSPDGNVHWTETFAASTTTAFYNGKQTADAGYVMCGYMVQSEGNTRALVCKATASGEEQWTKIFEANQKNQFYCIENAGNSGYIACGYTKSNVSANRDLYIVKTGLQGERQWSKVFKPLTSGNNFDGAYWVLPELDGGFLICGSLADTAKTKRHGFLMKLSAQGDSLWMQRFSGYAFSMERTADSGIIIGGQKVNDGKYHLYMAKYTKTHVLEWEKTYDAAAYAYGTQVIQCLDGSYALTGTTAPENSTNYDVVLVNADANGEKKWIQTYGGAKLDEGFGLVQVANANLYIAGFSLSSGKSTILLNKIGNTDGSLIWHKDFE